MFVCFFVRVARFCVCCLFLTGCDALRLRGRDIGFYVIKYRKRKIKKFLRKNVRDFVEADHNASWNEEFLSNHTKDDPVVIDNVCVCFFFFLSFFG